MSSIWAFGAHVWAFWKCYHLLYHCLPLKTYFVLKVGSWGWLGQGCGWCVRVMGQRDGNRLLEGLCERRG